MYMQIKSSGADILIHLSLIEKIFSLHGDFRIPKKDIVNVSQDLPRSTWRDLRIPGTFFPGLIKAGTYFTPRGREFWYVTRFQNEPVSIELKNSFYKHLILGFSSPAQAKAALAAIT